MANLWGSESKDLATIVQGKQCSPFQAVTSEIYCLFNSDYHSKLDFCTSLTDEESRLLSTE